MVVKGKEPGKERGREKGLTSKIWQAFLARKKVQEQEGAAHKKLTLGTKDRVRRSADGMKKKL